MNVRATQRWLNLGLGLVLISACLLCFGVNSPRARALFWGPSVASNDEIFSYVTDLVNFGYRRPGTPAESAAADYVASKFNALGLQGVTKEAVPFKRWDASSWSLSYQERVGSSTRTVTVPSFYIPYSAFSAAAGNTGSLVYVGEGKESDYRGKAVAGHIVVAEIRFIDPSEIGVTSHPATWQISNWAAYDRAVAAGAAGFVGILRDYWDRNTFYSPADNPLKPFDIRKIPGLWITKKEGDKLIQAIHGGAAGNARLTLRGSETPNANMYNVYGFLPGQTDDVIMIHSHHDAPFSGAVEDASGVAEVLAIAKYFSQIPTSWRKKTLLFLSASGHFHNYAGNQAFIERHALRSAGESESLVDRIMVDFCVEHVAMEYVEQNGQIVATGKQELAGMFVSSPALLPIATAATAYWLKRTIPFPYPIKQGFFTDARDYQAYGIPVVSYISGPMYIYDENDTLEKVAKDQLKNVASSFVDMIIATDELDPSVVTQF